MALVDGLCVAALLAIGLTFYFVRKIPAYLIASSLIVVAFAGATIASVEWSNPSSWLVMTLGLMLCIFGLLIVRVMLVRSVSLNMLASIQGGRTETFGEDIGARLGDMRAFRLIRSEGGLNSLTSFGRFVSVVVAVLYTVFRIRA